MVKLQKIMSPYLSQNKRAAQQSLKKMQSASLELNIEYLTL